MEKGYRDGDGDNDGVNAPPAEPYGPAIFWEGCTGPDPKKVIDLNGLSLFSLCNAVALIHSISQLSASVGRLFKLIGATALYAYFFDSALWKWAWEAKQPVDHRNGEASTEVPSDPGSLCPVDPAKVGNLVVNDPACLCLEKLSHAPS